MEADRIARERAEAERELRHTAEEQAAAQAAQEACAAEEQAERERAEARAAEASEDAALAMLAEQRARASSAFAELSATAATSTAVLEPDVSEPVDAEPDEDAAVTPYRPADTDMASLFRELSSLGMDDEPAPAPLRATPTPRSPVAGTPAKKKKGLFGR